MLVDKCPDENINRLTFIQLRLCFKVFCLLEPRLFCVFPGMGVAFFSIVCSVALCVVFFCFFFRGEGCLGYAYCSVAFSFKKNIILEGKAVWILFHSLFVYVGDADSY